MDSIKDVLPTILTNLQDLEKNPKQKIWSHWKEIVGEKFYQNSKPSLMEDGTLFVWTDESVVAFEINQRYKMSILRRAQELVGKEKVKQLRVRVGQLR